MESLELKANNLHWIESTGGPLLLVSMEDANKWKGSLCPHYEEACKIKDEIEEVSVDEFSYVLLGEEAYPTTSLASGSGGCLLRWVYGDDDDGLLDSLRKSPNRLNRERTDIKIKTGPSGCLLLFDSANTKDQAKGDLLEITLHASTSYGINWDYMDLNSNYRVMVCNIFALP